MTQNFYFQYCLKYKKSFLIHFEKVIPASFPLLNHKHRVVVD